MLTRVELQVDGVHLSLDRAKMSGPFRKLTVMILRSRRPRGETSVTRAVTNKSATWGRGVARHQQINLTMPSVDNLHHECRRSGGKI